MFFGKYGIGTYLENITVINALIVGKDVVEALENYVHPYKSPKEKLIEALKEYKEHWLDNHIRCYFHE